MWVRKDNGFKNAVENSIETFIHTLCLELK